MDQVLYLLMGAQGERLSVRIVPKHENYRDHELLPIAEAFFESVDPTVYRAQHGERIDDDGGEGQLSVVYNQLGLGAATLHLAEGDFDYSDSKLLFTVFALSGVNRVAEILMLADLVKHFRKADADYYPWFAGAVWYRPAVFVVDWQSAEGAEVKVGTARAAAAKLIQPLVGWQLRAFDKTWANMGK